MHFDSAGSPKVCAAGFSALGVRHFDGKFSHERALVEILLNSSLRGPCMMLYRSLTEDLVEILVRSSLRGPCMKILQMTCPRGACMKGMVGGSWKVFCVKIL